MRKREQIIREQQLEARIKELENIICPAKRHEYTLVDKKYRTVLSGGIVDLITVKRYVCRKCLREREVLEY